MPKKALIRDREANNDGLPLWLILNVLAHIGFMMISSLLNLFPGLFFYFFQVSLFALNISRMHDSLYDDSKSLGVAPIAYQLSKKAVITRNLLGAAALSLTIAAYALLFISPIAPLFFIATECLWAAYAIGKYSFQMKNYISDNRTKESRFFRPKIVSSSYSLVQQLGMAIATACMFLIPGAYLVVLPVIAVSIFLLIGVKFWENKQIIKIEKELQKEWEAHVKRTEEENPSNHEPYKKVLESSHLKKTPAEKPETASSSTESTPLLGKNASSYFKQRIPSGNPLRINNKLRL